jgi:transposase
MGRYDLTEQEWQAIQPHLPNKPRGVPRVDDRRVLNGIFWVLRSGAFWSDLPERYGPPTTIYNRFNRWRKAGVWDRLMDEITRLYDGDVQMIDTSIVRVHQHGATAKRGARMEALIDVWVVPEVALPQKSMRLSTGKADRSSSNSPPARKATSRAPRT